MTVCLKLESDVEDTMVEESFVSVDMLELNGGELGLSH